MSGKKMISKEDIPEKNDEFSDSSDSEEGTNEEPTRDDKTLAIVNEDIDNVIDEDDENVGEDSSDSTSDNQEDGSDVDGIVDETMNDYVKEKKRCKENGVSATSKDIKKRNRPSRAYNHMINIEQERIRLLDSDTVRLIKDPALMTLNTPQGKRPSVEAMHQVGLLLITIFREMPRKLITLASWSPYNVTLTDWAMQSPLAIVQRAIFNQLKTLEANRKKRKSNIHGGFEDDPTPIVFEILPYLAELHNSIDIIEPLRDYIAANIHELEDMPFLETAFQKEMDAYDAFIKDRYKIADLKPTNPNYTDSCIRGGPVEPLFTLYVPFARERVRFLLNYIEQYRNRKALKSHLKSPIPALKAKARLVQMMLKVFKNHPTTAIGMRAMAQLFLKRHIIIKEFEN